MRHLLASLLFILCIEVFAQTSDFVTYSVKADDTATSLAERFNTTVSEIYRFNPDAKNGLRIGAVLVIPVDKTNTQKVTNAEQRVPKTFETHKVRRKETLYSLSKKYNVSIEEIKRYNKWLYANQLKRRDKLRIPVYPDVNIPTSQTVSQPEFVINEAPIAEVTPKDNVNDAKTHVVKAKEGKYGISRKYGMTIEELEALNPDMQEPLQPGDVLVVSGEANTTDTVITDERFTFYKVKPKENFYRLEKRFDISKDSLLALNPGLEDGLKAGMVIKIPNTNNDGSFIFENETIVNLEHSLSNYKSRTIALMLPFNMHKIGMDSISDEKTRLKKDRVMRIALDFYSGAMIAFKKAERLGLNLKVKVYDTEQSASKVNQIIDTYNLDNVDAVIGPILTSALNEAAAKLRYKNVPVISPLSNRQGKSYDNFVQARPSLQRLHNVMLTYLDSMHNSQNVVIVADSESSSLKAKIMSQFPFAEVLQPEDDNFLYQSSVQNKLVEGTGNWFIVATEDVALLSNLTSYLNAFKSKYDIQLFALEKNGAFDSDDVSNAHLSNLKFTYPSVDKEFDELLASEFINAYKAEYGIIPNKYAVRGYDVTYDTVLRLANAETLLESYDNEYTTEYVESKFNYKAQPRGGYYNNGVYIMQHGENLSLKPIE